MQTRLEKYKKYRQQIKDVVENSKKNEKSPSTKMMVNFNTTNTSSALPLDEIVKEEQRISVEEIALKKQERKRILKYIAIVAGIVIMACIIIIIGILLFK